MRRPRRKAEKEGDEAMRLFGVGVGPGDPELLTLKARRVLEEVAVVFYPAGARESLALGIAAQAARLPRELVPLDCLSGGSPEAVAQGWRRAAELVAHTLRRVGEGAFITEGDPLLYSTFRHLWRALEEVAPEVAVEIVPGIPAFLAAAARARFPLVEGGESLVLVPASRRLRGEAEELRHHLTEHRTLVLYKVARPFSRLVEALADVDADALLAERLGLSGEFLGAPEAARGRRLDYFSLMLVRRRKEG